MLELEFNRNISKIPYEKCTRIKSQRRQTEVDKNEITAHTITKWKGTVKTAKPVFFLRCWLRHDECSRGLRTFAPCTTTAGFRLKTSSCRVASVTLPSQPEHKGHLNTHTYIHVGVELRCELLTYTPVPYSTIINNYHMKYMLVERTSTTCGTRKLNGIDCSNKNIIREI